MRFHHSPRLITLSLMTALMSLQSASVMAAGYAVKESSPSLMGSAFSGAAVSNEDISSMHNNPATLGLIDDATHVYAGLSGIFPNFDASHVKSSAYPNAKTEANNIGNEAVVPALYIAKRIMPQVAIGLAITTPWGLVTEYENDWAGGTHGINSRMASVNINPLVAYNVNDKLTIAGGPELQYVRAELSSRVPTSLGGKLAVVKGDDWATGGSIGALYKIDSNLTMGLSYQTEVRHKVTGSTHYDVPALETLAGGSASTNVATPQSVNIGFGYQIDPKVTLQLGAQWTDWAAFKELRIKTKTRAGTMASDIVVDEHWKPAWFYSLGALYHADSNLTYRFGIAYDQTPLEDEFRTPRIPDQNRVWASIGAGYRYCKRLNIDLGYTHLFVKKQYIDNKGTGTDSTRGSLTAKYKGSIDLIAVGFNWSY